MGYSGSVTLVNGSPFDWTLSSSHSYQMDTWSWPTVQAGKAVKVPVTFGTSGSTGDDAGEAYYNIGSSGTFEVQAKKPSAYDITVDLTGVATKTSPKGSNVDLGFRQNAAVNWILSTDEAGNNWSNSGTTTDWMQQNLGSLGNRTLKQIVMPGSHDAGMSTFTPGTVGANFANTQSQYLDFYNQLVIGSRFFDLRPVISSGAWVTGHYSEVESVWVGGNGQKISDIVSQINQFTASNQELIIIDLSHTLDSDNNYADLTQAQWNSLFDTLKGINNRFTVSNPGSTDYTNSKLSDFITDRASVFIFAELPSGISLGDYASQGFFTSTNFPNYNSYSNSDSASTMESDQLAKLQAQRNLVADASQRKDTFHILSWTLTQQVLDVINEDDAIMNLGASVFDDLVSVAFNAFTPESFPNVLYVDALGIRDKAVVFPYQKVATVPTNTDIAALAVAVNHGIAGRNSYITGS